MELRGTSEGELVKATGLDKKLVRAIVSGNYIASPTQRERLSAALGVLVGDICWDHSVPVQHLRGNGPQCGRST